MSPLIVFPNPDFFWAMFPICLLFGTFPKFSSGPPPRCPPHSQPAPGGEAGGLWPAEAPARPPFPWQILQDFPPLSGAGGTSAALCGCRGLLPHLPPFRLVRLSRNWETTAGNFCSRSKLRTASREVRLYFSGSVLAPENSRKALYISVSVMLILFASLLTSLSDAFILRARTSASLSQSRAALPFHRHFARADLSAASSLMVCWCRAKPSGRRLPALLLHGASLHLWEAT